MNAEHETPEWLKFVDHTADAGIAVEAPDLVRLFERAAWGMFSVITDVAAARSTETSRISIDAPDRAALLVRWLSELNYRHVIEHRIFSKFEVVTLSEKHLKAGCGEVPPEYRAIGQPVLIPGDMGRYSYVLTGTEKAMHDTFGSTCHGAGRAMSRVKARQAAAGRNIIREMEERGIIIRGQSRRTVDEEISEAYKDVSNVVDTCALAGISRKVAQLRPFGCIKG